MAKEDIELLTVGGNDDIYNEPKKKNNKKRPKSNLKIDFSDKRVKIAVGVLIVIVVLLLLFPLIKGKGTKSLSNKEKEEYTSLYNKIFDSELDIDEGYNISFIDLNDDVIPEMIVKYGKAIYRVYTIRDNKTLEIQGFHIDGDIDPDYENGQFKLFFDRKEKKPVWFFLTGEIYYRMNEIIDKDYYERFYTNSYEINKEYSPMITTIDFKSIHSANVTDIIKEMIGKENYKTKYDLKEVKKRAKNLQAHMVVCTGSSMTVEGYPYSKEFIYIDEELSEIYYKVALEATKYDDASLSELNTAILEDFSVSPNTWGVGDQTEKQITLFYKYYKDKYCKNTSDDCGDAVLNFKDINKLIEDKKSENITCEIK
jgi:hypothetical protein